MNIKSNYPMIEKQNVLHILQQNLMICCKWTFLFAGFICAVVNLSTGGKAWSIIVIWSMWLVWTQLVSPDMVEYNRISQTIKLIVNSCILLLLLDVIVISGSTKEAVAVTCFSALIFVSILFFTDFETQRQNMFPMLFFCVTCLIGSIIGLVTIHGGETWTFAVLGALAVSLLIGCAAKLGKEFVRECKKYFCTK
jgi:hypothetical protein